MAPMRKRDDDKQLVHNSFLFPAARALFLSPFHSRRILLLLLLLVVLVVRDVRTHRMQFNISAAARFVHVDAPLCIPPTRPHSFTLMHHNLRCICRGAQRLLSCPCRLPRVARIFSRQLKKKYIYSRYHEFYLLLLFKFVMQKLYFTR